MKQTISPVRNTKAMFYYLPVAELIDDLMIQKWHGSAKIHLDAGCLDGWIPMVERMKNGLNENMRKI